jgi:Raf kinase inhibitor-like YbhB/YbcL family protein
MPSRYGSEFGNVSPALEWAAVPDGAKELAVVFEDLESIDPVPFVHWFVHGVQPHDTGCEEGELPSGAVLGLNSTGISAYFGPAPPPGHVHEYRVLVLALDQPVSASKPLDWTEYATLARNHVIEEAVTSGTFASPGSAAPEGVETLLRKYIRANRDRDPQALAALFADGGALLAAGTRLSERESITSHFVTRFGHVPTSATFSLKGLAFDRELVQLDWCFEENKEGLVAGSDTMVIHSERIVAQATFEAPIGKQRAG